MATRRNLCLNPNFEAGTTYWGGANGAAVAQDATRSVAGTKSCLLTHAAGAGVTSVASYSMSGQLTVGKRYTASAWIYVPAATGTNAQLWVSSIGAGNVVSEKDKWVRSSRTFVATASTNNIYIATTGATTAGQQMWFDAVLIEEAAAVGDYFDGDTYDFPGFDNAWEGTANNSVSVQTTNNIVRRNSTRNPTCGVSVADWATAQGSTGGTLPIARVPADGSLIVGAANVGTQDLSYARATWTNAGTGAHAGTGIVVGVPNAPVVQCAGGPFSLSGYMRCSSPGRTVRIAAGFHDNAGVQIGGLLSGTTVTLDPVKWTRVTLSTIAPTGSTRVYCRFYAMGGPIWVTNDTIDLGGVLSEVGVSTNGPYFDGDTPDQRDIVYDWLGTAHASESVRRVTSDPTQQTTDTAIFQSLLDSGYAPGTISDMEYKRLCNKLSYTTMPPLTLYDLYALAKEKPRI